MAIDAFPYSPVAFGEGAPTSITQRVVVANELPVWLTATVTLTNASEQYTYSLTNVAAFSFRCRGATAAIRYSSVASTVATPTGNYHTLEVASDYAKEFPPGQAYTGTLYLASSFAGAVVEIETWSLP